MLITALNWGLPGEQVKYRGDFASEGACRARAADLAAASPGLEWTCHPVILPERSAG